MNALRTNRIVSILAALSIVASEAHAQNPAQSPAPTSARQPAQKALPADSVELGRKYAYWFLAGMADSLSRT